jgi:hypothetical protein
MAESSPDKQTYEKKIVERFGGQQELELVLPVQAPSPSFSEKAGGRRLSASTERIVRILLSRPFKWPAIAESQCSSLISGEWLNGPGKLMKTRSRAALPH